MLIKQVFWVSSDCSNMFGGEQQNCENAVPLSDCNDLCSVYEKKDGEGSFKLVPCHDKGEIICQKSNTPKKRIIGFTEKYC